MAKVVCVLYEDPVTGYPKSYARDDIPKLQHYPGGQTLPTPEKVDFKPGQLLGSVSGELGLRKFLEGRGHTTTPPVRGADQVPGDSPHITVGPRRVNPRDRVCDAD